MKGRREMREGKAERREGRKEGREGRKEGRRKRSNRGKVTGIGDSFCHKGKNTNRKKKKVKTR